MIGAFNGGEFFLFCALGYGLCRVEEPGGSSQYPVASSCVGVSVICVWGKISLSKKSLFRSSTPTFTLHTNSSPPEIWHYRLTPVKKISHVRYLQLHARSPLTLTTPYTHTHTTIGYWILAPIPIHGRTTKPPSNIALSFRSSICSSFAVTFTRANRSWSFTIRLLHSH